MILPWKYIETLTILTTQNTVLSGFSSGIKYGGNFYKDHLNAVLNEEAT